MKRLAAGAWLCLFMIVAGTAQDARAEDKGYFDADNLDEAAGMAIEQSDGYTTVMDHCREKHPEGAFAFRMADYVWREDNDDMLLAAHGVVGTKMSALEAKFQVANDVTANLFAASFDRCMAFADELVKGKKDLKVYTPKAYAFLHAAYSRDDHMIAEWKRTQFEAGCMKGYANKGGRNFDQAIASCRCVTAGFYSALTAAERADFDAHARDPDYMQHSPIIQKIRGATRTCPALTH